MLHFHAVHNQVYFICLDVSNIFTVCNLMGSQVKKSGLATEAQFAPKAFVCVCHSYASVLNGVKTNTY